MELSPFKSNYRRTSHLVELDYQLTQKKNTGTTAVLESSNNLKRGCAIDYGLKILMVMKLRMYAMVIASCYIHHKNNPFQIYK